MKKIIVSAAAAALISTAASASVTGDAASGWFVGKGDVQNAFGWNNATLQQEWAAGEISFHYTNQADYDVTCEWDTGVKKITHHVVNSTISRGLSASIAAEGRQKNQITGFNLAPAGTSSNGGDVPSVGESCGDYEDVDGNAEFGSITGVTPLGSSGEGGLYVSWNGQDVLLQSAS